MYSKLRLLWNTQSSTYLKPPNSIYLWAIQQQSLGFKSGNEVQSRTWKIYNVWNALKFIPSGYPTATAFRIQKWNCPWCRKKPLFQNFIGWKTFIVFTFAPYILTKLTDFLQTKRDMCLRGLVWAWAAKPSWDLSTGCCCYWAIFDTTVEFSFSTLSIQT